MAGHRTRPLICVLGASGLVGTAVTRELAGRPVRLRLVGRRAPIVPDRPVADIEVLKADLTDGVADAVADADAVIHLAAHTKGPGAWRSAESDPAAERVNLGLVHDVLGELARRPRDTPPVLLLAGSISQPEPGAPPDHMTVYDRHKQAAQDAVAKAHAQGIVRGTCLRLATVYSQGREPTHLDNGIIATMTRRALLGEPLTVWHRGTARRDLVCVDDVARAFTAALDRPETTDSPWWSIGRGVPTTVADLFVGIAAAVAARTGRPQVPVVSTEPEGFAVSADRLDFVADPTGFSHATGWRPRVDLATGLDGIAAAMTRESSR